MLNLSLNLGGSQTGEVIRKSAAAVDILADARTTLASARARGGDWQSLAESRLGALTPLLDTIESRLAAAEAELVPLKAAVHARDDEADRLLGRISDEIFRHAARERAWQPLAPTEGMEQIEEHFARFFDKPETVFHEIVSDQRAFLAIAEPRRRRLCRAGTGLVTTNTRLHTTRRCRYGRRVSECRKFAPVSG